MKMTLQKAVEMQGAIHALQNFKFSAKTTLDLATNLRTLSEAFPDANKIRDGFLEELGHPPDTDPKFAIFVRKWTAHLNDTEIEPKLVLIPYEQLRVGESEKLNQIPPALVAALIPLLSTPEQN